VEALSHEQAQGQATVIGLALVVVLVACVAWGATTRPGRPFSWTMYSGSSKAFLWTETDASLHVASYESLRLAPDSHYLSEADLRRLLAEAEAPPGLHGLIIGSRTSWSVATGADPHCLASVALAEHAALPELAEALRRFGCSPPPSPR